MSGRPDSVAPVTKQQLRSSHAVAAAGPEPSPPAPSVHVFSTGSHHHGGCHVPRAAPPQHPAACPRGERVAFFSDNPTLKFKGRTATHANQQPTATATSTTNHPPQPTKPPPLQVCVFTAPLFSAFCALSAYGLVSECRSDGAGLVAAAMVAMVPSYISRSVAGSYDNEGVAIFALVNVFYTFIKVGAGWALGWLAGYQGARVLVCTPVLDCLIAI